MREHKATYADRPAEKRFRMIRIPMSVEMFHQLPPNGAYKYEYADGQTLISPQPHACELYLELDSFTAPERESYERWSVRQLAEDDWDELPNVAAAAFNRVAPYATFGDREIKEVMAEELQVTRSGDDGELVREACMVAEEPWGEDLRGCGCSAGDVTERPDQWRGNRAVDDVDLCRPLVFTSWHCRRVARARGGEAQGGGSSAAGKHHLCRQSRVSDVALAQGVQDGAELARKAAAARIRA